VAAFGSGGFDACQRVGRVARRRSRLARDLAERLQQLEDEIQVESGTDPGWSSIASAPDVGAADPVLVIPDVPAPQPDLILEDLPEDLPEEIRRVRDELRLVAGDLGTCSTNWSPKTNRATSARGWTWNARICSA
jgi:hypothetical protein